MSNPFIQPIHRIGDMPDRPLKTRIVDTDEKVGRAVEHLLRYDVLGFDTETYHKFNPGADAFNPCEGARMRLSQWSTPDGFSYVFDHFKVSPTYLHYMFPNKFVCVIQNAKFELKYLMFELGIYDFGPIWDTFIAEQVLSRGRVSGDDRMLFGLEHIAKRRLSVQLSKDEQASQWYRSDLSKSQIKYAARDSQVVLPIYQRQVAQLWEQSQIRVAELEFNTTPALAWMENNGFRMNAEKWVEIADKTKQEIQSVKQELWDLLKTQNTLFDGIATINLNSQKQVMKALEDRGIPIPVNPETNEPTLSNKLLQKELGQFNYRAVELYIKYVKSAKKLSSFGPNWVDKINPYDGRIHCSLKQIGAETGRMACGSPNLMQIPKENEYRNCFEAREGWVLIDKDYSQCELRILAEYCRDPALLRAFDEDKDLHRYTASLLYKTAFEDVDDTQRSMAKNMNFLIVYGGGAYKLAYNADIPVEDAEAILNLYLNEVYPDMSHWLDGRAQKVLEHFRADTMTGRLRQFIGDFNDKKKRSKIQRNAKNMPIQGTNADITKQALGQVYRRFVKENLIDVASLTLPVHDEIVAESRPDYAQQVDALITEEMLNAEGQYLRRVPCKVDGDITRVWCKSPLPEHIAEGQEILRTWSAVKELLA